MGDHNSQQSDEAAPSFIFGNNHHLADDSRTCSLNTVRACGVEECNFYHRKQTPNKQPEQLNQEKEAMHRYLADSMNRLSFEDKEIAIHELHGIASRGNVDIATVSADLDKCLDSLENHLYLIKRGTAYERTEDQSKVFVMNPSLRLLFLQRNQYNTKSAAEQMIRFFDMKEELFGTEKLAQEILLGDLDPLSHECVASGCCQILSKPDWANRPILLVAPGLMKRYPLIHEIRAQFYIIMTFLRVSVDARKSGIVGILYTVGRFGHFDFGAATKRCARFEASLPIPLSGIHFCHDNLVQHIYVNAVLPLLPLSMIPKFKSHYGSHQECLYAMRNYGISEDSIPIVNSDSDRILDNHLRWYQEQKEKDAIIAIEKEALCAFDMGGMQDAACDDIVEQLRVVANSETIVPKSDDVLFGQHSQHPGNIRLHKLLEDHAAAYEQTEGKKEKMEFASKLVLTMKDQGSRFLSFDKASKIWTEVPDAKARLKVSKTIRNRRR